MTARILTVADVAKRLGVPTQRARRWLLKRRCLERTSDDAGGWYYTTYELLERKWPNGYEAMLSGDLPEEPEGDCPGCRLLQAEVTALESRLVDVATRLHTAERARRGS